MQNIVSVNVRSKKFIVFRQNVNQMSRVKGVIGYQRKQVYKNKEICNSDKM